MPSHGDSVTATAEIGDGGIPTTGGGCPRITRIRTFRRALPGRAASAAMCVREELWVVIDDSKDYAVSHARHMLTSFGPRVTALFAELHLGTPQSTVVE